MDRYIDYMTTKRGMATALEAVIDSGGNPYERSRDRLMDAIEEILSAGVRAGYPARRRRPGRRVRRPRGISPSAGAPQQRDQAGRLLDLLLAGLRPLT